MKASPRELKVAELSIKLAVSVLPINVLPDGGEPRVVMEDATSFQVLIECVRKCKRKSYEPYTKKSSKTGSDGIFTPFASSKKFPLKEFIIVPEKCCIKNGYVLILQSVE